MSVIAIINRKGGVGKTTLTIALADFLSALYRRRVLLIDLDAQGNLTIGCVGDLRWMELAKKKLTIADVFDSVIRGEHPHVHQEAIQRVRGAVPVSVIAGTPRLADIESEADADDQGWRDVVKSPYLLLRSALSRYTQAYDYTLIDCPPSLGLTTLNGLALSDGYIIPVMPSHVAVYGIEQITGKISQFARREHLKIKRYGTIVNRVDLRANTHRALIAELELNPDAAPVWATRVRATVRAEEGWKSEEPLTLAQRWGSLYSDLEALAQELVRRVP